AFHTLSHLRSLLLFLYLIRHPARSTLFPYTRSSDLGEGPAHVRVGIRRQQRRVGAVDPVGGAGEEVGGAERLRDVGHEVAGALRSEEHTSELQSRENLVCRLLLEKKKIQSTLSTENH